MTTAPTSRLRASDAEREQLATIVRAAMTEGRLNLEEGEERLAAVYAATYRDQFAPLTADLPDGGRRALLDTPEAHAEVRQHVRRHTAFVVAAALVLSGLWVLSGAHFFWPAIPLTFLVIGLARHRRWARHGHGQPWAHRSYAGGPHHHG